LVSWSDRLDGAAENLKAHGLALSSLFTKDDFQAK